MRWHAGIWLVLVAASCRSAPPAPKPVFDSHQPERLLTAEDLAKLPFKTAADIRFFKFGSDHYEYLVGDALDCTLIVCRSEAQVEDKYRLMVDNERISAKLARARWEPCSFKDKGACAVGDDDFLGVWSIKEPPKIKATVILRKRNYLLKIFYSEEMRKLKSEEVEQRAKATAAYIAAKL